jgi:hypothetical protein
MRPPPDVEAALSGFVTGLDADGATVEVVFLDTDRLIVRVLADGGCPECFEPVADVEKVLTELVESQTGRRVSVKLDVDEIMGH